METGIYIGPIEGLQGYKALLRDEFLYGGHVCVQAQFEKMPEKASWNYLSYGWHPFKKLEFEIDA